MRLKKTKTKTDLVHFRISFRSHKSRSKRGSKIQVELLIRALHSSALENWRKWYRLGVPRFFKRCVIWYLMVRLLTPRFFKWYLVTISQHCGKQMARYMVTFFLRGRQMARYMVTTFLRGRQMACYMVLQSINFLRGRQTARLR